MSLLVDIRAVPSRLEQEEPLSTSPIFAERYVDPWSLWARMTGIGSFQLATPSSAESDFEAMACEAAVPADQVYVPDTEEQAARRRLIHEVMQQLQSEVIPDAE